MIGEHADSAYPGNAAKRACCAGECSAGDLTGGHALGRDQGGHRAADAVASTRRVYLYRAGKGG